MFAKKATCFFLRMRHTGRATMMVRNRHLSTFSDSEERSHLLKFPGGSVDLSKDKKTGIATIALNNPKKKNALTGTMMLQLADVVSDLEQWNEGKGIILHGTGETFCSGGNLELVRTMAVHGGGVQMCLFMQNVLTRLHKLPCISVALLQGVALGGGAELPLFCDYRLVSERLAIQFLQSKLGVTTGFGGGTMLVKLIGRNAALDLLTTARTLSCREALDIGLADGILLGDDDLMQKTRDWLQKRISASVEVVRATKHLVVGAVEKEFHSSLKHEKDIFGNLWGGPAHLKALNVKTS